MIHSVTQYAGPWDDILVFVLVGAVLVGYWAIVHLLVTWNPYHRPSIPLLAATLLFTSPLLIFSTGLSEVHFSELSLTDLLALYPYILGIGFMILLLLAPLALIAATLQMVRVTLYRPSEDPLMDMVEG